MKMTGPGPLGRSDGGRDPDGEDDAKQTDSAATRRNPGGGLLGNLAARFGIIQAGGSVVVTDGQGNFVVTDGKGKNYGTLEGDVTITNGPGDMQNIEVTGNGFSIRTSTTPGNSSTTVSASGGTTISFEQGGTGFHHHTPEEPQRSRYQPLPTVKIDSIRDLETLRGAFGSISSIQDSTKWPAEIQHTAKHLAGLFQTGSGFEGTDERIQAYDELIEYAHATLNSSKAGPEPCLEAYAAICRLSEVLPSDHIRTREWYLARLSSEQKLSPAQRAVAMAVALDTIKDAPGAVRRNLIQIHLQQILGVEKGYRGPLLEAFAANLGRYPASDEYAASIAVTLTGLASQESASCQAKVKATILELVNSSPEWKKVFKTAIERDQKGMPFETIDRQPPNA